MNVTPAKIELYKIYWLEQIQVLLKFIADNSTRRSF